MTARFYVRESGEVAIFSVILYFYVLLNVRDKNPLYGRCFGSGKTLSGYLHKPYAEIGPRTS